MARRTKSRNSVPAEPAPASAPSDSNPENSQTIPTNGPQFGEPTPTPDPTKFSVKHGSDSQAYKNPRQPEGFLTAPSFPIASEAEPRLTLSEALGKKGSDIENAITRAGQIVFHSLGDTGNTKGPHDMEVVADKMVSDYPAPIFAVPGNHDGMVAPNSQAETLAAFLENFCTYGQPPHRTPESGGLARTAQVQPGV